LLDPVPLAEEEEEEEEGERDLPCFLSFLRSFLVLSLDLDRPSLPILMGVSEIGEKLADQLSTAMLASAEIPSKGAV